MTSTLPDIRSSLTFISDIHLGGSPELLERVKRERLFSLIDRITREEGSLYILGDLFDFWFEYRSVIPRAAVAVIARLDALARSGSPVRFLAGNHDFWLADFLRRETAIEVVEDGSTVQAQGRTVRLFHGDGRGPGDHGYKTLKRVVRNRLAIGLFRWVHPDIGIPFALWTSGTSRHHTAERPVDVERIYRHVGVPALEEGADAVLIGHHHVARHLRRAEGEMLFLGDWFRQFTCARLESGRLELLQWPLDRAVATE
jgi:UDP-2,3-diacylglucosamine hydrolase